MSTKVVGLVDCFNLPTFGPLTKHRLRASTVFLGRYCYIDFPLSNFRNSGIPSIGILCPGHIRSLSRHVGNGRSWIGNTKIGDFQVLYDEPRISSPGYNTDIACIQEQGLRSRLSSASERTHCFWKPYFASLSSCR